MKKIKQKPNVGGWTPKKLRQLERKYRQAMRQHMSNKGPNWIDFDGDQIPIHFVGYFINHLREVFGLKK